ncbi:MAG: histidinol-phosphate transaminase [Acidimicrobiia bacterium]|nr:histidinol-phosphate transaminase [Acidimicrobiia bacterium]NNF10039.1 histidinol-phosphate transaminase [Acidimicrobiia bacterium]
MEVLVPTFRRDLGHIPVYRPGRTPEEVRREFGLDSIVKLASNECPYEPFPAVVEAVRGAAAGVNRYPDNARRDLRAALASFLGVSPDQLWLGGGSNELMYVTALAAGGPGTSAVFAEPSFGLYRIASQIALAEPIPVPLDGAHRHDLAAMADAIRDDTTVAYVCNPNNPTGTHVPSADLDRFIASVPERVLVVVDEAYFEFASAADYGTALGHALERSNVVVARTFSKAYGLAGLRTGYFVGDASTLEQLRSIQLPFSVGNLAQVAAMEAIKHQDLVRQRTDENRTELEFVSRELAARGLPVADSQANFVYLPPPVDADAWYGHLQSQGVIVRVAGGGVRISIGTNAENTRLLAAVDNLLAGG